MKGTEQRKREAASRIVQPLKLRERVFTGVIIVLKRETIIIGT